jgi:hypothetical protein
MPNHGTTPRKMEITSIIVTNRPPRPAYKRTVRTEIV